MINERFMRMPDVTHQIGFCSGKIYALIREKRFPPPIKLGRSSVWLRSEVSEWMSERINEARA